MPLLCLNRPMEIRRRHPPQKFLLTKYTKSWQHFKHSCADAGAGRY
jgi:hypothetical protein